MSDETSERDFNVVADYEVWCLQISVDGDTWLQFGPDHADLAAVLRVYDYREKRNPEEKHRIARSRVVTFVEDIEHLRKRVDEKDSSPEQSAVQSE